VKRGAFTMIELSVVVLIMAIAAAAVTLNVRKYLGGARMDDATGAIAEFDRTTRTAAIAQNRPLRLVIGLTDGKIARADQAGHPLPGSGFALPGTVHISRLLLRGRDMREGETAISCSRAGLTPTYAMELDDGGRRQWLIVAGMTGQVVKVDSENDAKEILAAAGGRNAR
jgi:prepilin-type N-terminal cleavage/methylation domain-containing protein